MIDSSYSAKSLWAINRQNDIEEKGPLKDAYSQDVSFQGHPFSCRYFNTSNCP